MSGSQPSHDATTVPPRRPPTTNTGNTTSAGVFHQSRPERITIPPDWPMAAELQRPATGDGTRQAGGDLSFEPTRVTVGARAARRSWLPSPGKRPLRGRFQTEKAWLGFGETKKGWALAAMPCNFFLCFRIHFLEKSNAVRTRRRSSTGRDARHGQCLVRGGGPGRDRSLLCVRYREGGLCWMSLRGYTWKRRTICRLVSCESPDRAAIFWTALLRNLRGRNNP